MTVAVTSAVTTESQNLEVSVLMHCAFSRGQRFVSLLGLVHVSYSGDGGSPYDGPSLLLWLPHIKLIILKILKT